AELTWRRIRGPVGTRLEQAGSNAIGAHKIMPGRSCSVTTTGRIAAMSEALDSRKPDIHRQHWSSVENDRYVLRWKRRRCARVALGTGFWVLRTGIRRAFDRAPRRSS